MSEQLLKLEVEMESLDKKMKSAAVGEKDAEDRVKWMQMLHCGDP